MSHICPTNQIYSSGVPPSPTDSTAQSKPTSDPPKNATFKELADKLTTYLINPPSQYLGILFYQPSQHSFPSLLQRARTKVHNVAPALQPTQGKGKGSAPKKMLFSDEQTPKVPSFPAP